MKIISKIMRFSIENDSPINIDYVINNITDRQDLNNMFEKILNAKK